MNVVLARPGDEKLSLPGSFLARSMTSLRVFAGTSGCEIRNSGAEPSRVMPAKSFTGSNGSVLADQAGDGVAVGGDHQRVAVGRRLGDRGGAGETGPVLDDRPAGPSAVPISSAKMRARMSVTQPAPNGTTMVTRWVGQLCADAGVASPAATTAARPSIHRPICLIVFLPEIPL